MKNKANSNQLLVLFLMIFLLFPVLICAQNNKNDKLADKPLFRDPIYDGAADPTIIWNNNEKKWFMFYTNRRANVKGLDGVSWVHGTRIGIAESSDVGATWKYRDTCDIQYRLTEYTHWAPEVIENNGLYHMFLSYVPGIFTNWDHPRWIVHLTSRNLINWKGKNWMLVDNWNGIGIYSSEDFINWKRQEKNILQEPGKGLDDNVIGGHPDIVVNGERAYIFYFTHPGRTIDNRGKDDYQTRRSSIQVAELEYVDGQIICNRDEPVYINLSLPNK